MCIECWLQFDPFKPVIYLMFRNLLALGLSQESKTALIANCNCCFGPKQGSADRYRQKGVSLWDRIYKQFWLYFPMHSLSVNVKIFLRKGGNKNKFLVSYLVPEGKFSPLVSRKKLLYCSPPALWDQRLLD